MSSTDEDCWQLLFYFIKIVVEQSDMAEESFFVVVFLYKSIERIRSLNSNGHLVLSTEKVNDSLALLYRAVFIQTKQGHKLNYAKFFLCIAYLTKMK